MEVGNHIRLFPWNQNRFGFAKSNQCAP